MKLEQPIEIFIDPAQQKINEYAERIRKGEDSAQVMQGLGPNFRDGIKKRLLELESQDGNNNKTKEVIVEKTNETNLESQSQLEIFIEEVPDQQQILQEQQKQERLVKEQKRIEELRKQLGVVESNNQDETKEQKKVIEELKNLSNKKEVSFNDIWQNDLNFRKFYEQRALWQVRNYNPEWLKRDGYDSQKISPNGYFMKLDGTEADETPSQLLNENNLGGISYEKFKEHILEGYLSSNGKEGIV